MEQYKIYKYKGFEYKYFMGDVSKAIMLAIYEDIGGGKKHIRLYSYTINEYNFEHIEQYAHEIIDIIDNKKHEQR